MCPNRAMNCNTWRTTENHGTANIIHRDEMHGAILRCQQGSVMRWTFTTCISGLTELYVHLFYFFFLADLQYWTTIIQLDSQAIIDTKPSSLVLCDARKTHIHSGNSARASVEPPGPSPFQLGNQNYIPILIVLPQSWQYPSAIVNAGSAGAMPSHNVPLMLPEQLKIEWWF